MDEAVAARLVEGVVDIVRHRVVEHGVQDEPRQLFVGDSVVDCRVAVGDDLENKGDKAVLAMTASEVE